MRLVALALLVACTQAHSPGAVELGTRDCYACHRNDYDTAPNHAGNRPTTCADCHRLSDWKGLAGGTHPEAQFVISRGPHQPILCADCHDPDLGSDSTNGMNVSCIGCHTGAHDMAVMQQTHHEVAKFAWDPARPTFCRDCHRFGLN